MTLLSYTYSEYSFIDLVKLEVYLTLFYKIVMKWSWISQSLFIKSIKCEKCNTPSDWLIEF